MWSAPAARSRGLWTLLPFALPALLKLAVHLATNGNYGFHRDSLYYLASARHPAWGYVDYPAVTPMLARLDVAVFGTSPWTLRLLPALAGATIVLLVPAICRELGGGRFAQVLAGVAALCSPLLLGSNWLFQTVTFDQLAWSVCIWLAARLLRTGKRWLWPLLGVVFGAGLETKYTILALGVGLAAGLMLSRRRGDFATPWPWLGLVIAAAAIAPNLAWQVGHGWPSVQYTFNHHGAQASDFTIASFLLGQIALVGPLALPLWIGGWFELFRRPALRPLGVTAAVAFGVFLLTGKNYYAGAVYPLLLAAGGVWTERVSRARPWLRVAMPALAVTNAVVLLSVALPLVPVGTMTHSFLGHARTDFADTVGWPDLVSEVSRVYHGLSPAEQKQTAVLAVNYGEAGAIDLYGPAHGLPHALSPELTYWYWRPRHVAATTIILIGFSPDQVGFLCGSLRQAGTVTNSYGLHNPEWGSPIDVCGQLKTGLDAAWPRLRSFQ